MIFKKTHDIVHIALIVLGIVVIIGSLIKGRHEAIIIGVIVAAVNFHILKPWNRKEKKKIS